jgi:hypothetical protein
MSRAAVPRACRPPLAVAEEPFHRDTILVRGSCALMCPAPLFEDTPGYYAQTGNM